MSNLRTMGFALFFLAMLGFVTHTLGSGLFLITLLIATGFNIAYLVSAKKWPFNSAERRQQTFDRSASLAEAIPPGHGVVYLFRERSLTAPVIVDVALDGAGIAELRPATFAKWTLPAGNYNARAAVKGTNVMAENQSSTFGFEVVSDQTLYLQIKVTASLSKYTAQLIREPAGPGLASRIAKLTITDVRA